MQQIGQTHFSEPSYFALLTNSTGIHQFIPLANLYIYTYTLNMLHFDLALLCHWLKPYTTFWNALRHLLSHYM